MVYKYCRNKESLQIRVLACINWNPHCHSTGPIPHRAVNPSFIILNLIKIQCRDRSQLWRPVRWHQGLTGHWMKQATALVPHRPSRAVILAHTCWQVHTTALCRSARLAPNKRRCHFPPCRQGHFQDASFPRLTRLICSLPNKWLLGARTNIRQEKKAHPPTPAPKCRYGGYCGNPRAGHLWSAGRLQEDPTSACQGQSLPSTLHIIFSKNHDEQSKSCLQSDAASTTMSSTCVLPQHKPQWLFSAIVDESGRLAASGGIPSP